MRQRTLDAVVRTLQIEQSSSDGSETETFDREDEQPESDQNVSTSDEEDREHNIAGRAQAVQKFYRRQPTLADGEETEIIRGGSNALNVEDGFTLEIVRQSGYQRRVYHCRHERMVGGVMQRCAHMVRVYDWESTAPDKRGSHRSHKFAGIQEADGTVPEADGPRCLKSRYADVYRLIARNVCTMNISIRNGCSREMFEPIWKAMEIAHTGSRPGQSPAGLLPTVSRDVMRRLIIEEGRRASDEALHDLMAARNVAICIDGGTAGSFHILEMIVNHRGKEVHLCSMDVSGETMDGKNYAKKAIEALRICDQFRIHVLCFVGDGLPAQFNGLSGDHDNSFQKLKECSGAWKKVFFMPCMLHRINLIIPHARRRYDWFSAAMQSYHDLSVALRKNETRAWLKERCPLLVVTRWVYGYDVINFIFKHRQAIRERAVGDNVRCRLIEMAYEYRQLYAPMKALVLSLSTKGVSIAHVLPCVIACIQSWHKMEFDHTGHVDQATVNERSPTLKNLRDFLMVDLAHQTIRSDVGPLLSLAYMLSYRGHHEVWIARNSESGDLSEHVRQFIPETPWIDTEKLTATDIDMGPEQWDEEEDENEVMDEDTRDTDGDPVPEEAIPNDEAKRREFIEDIGRKFLTLYADACAGIDLWQKKYMKNDDEELMTEIKRQLHTWIETPPWKVHFPELDNYSGLEAWCEVRRSGCRPDLLELAKLAEKLLSIPATEITCERSFAIQNYICTTRSRRAKHDLINARVKLMQGRG